MYTLLPPYILYSNLLQCVVDLFFCFSGVAIISCRTLYRDCCNVTCRVMTVPQP